MTGIIWTDNRNKEKVKRLLDKIIKHHEENGISKAEEHRSANRTYISFENGDSIRVIQAITINSIRGHKCEISYIDNDLSCLEEYGLIKNHIEVATIGKYQTFIYF